MGEWVNSRLGQRLRVKSETLSKTFKRTQIPRGQDKTCISQVGGGADGGRGFLGGGEGLLFGSPMCMCLCVCVKNMPMLNICRMLLLLLYGVSGLAPLR